MEKIIKAKSPVRIGLGGGGTDVSPFCDEYGGAVLNITINQYAYATLKLREDTKVILKSLDLDEEATFDSLDDVKLDGHLDLLKAVSLRLAKPLTTGFELTTECNVPPRSGLGSSAAVFCAGIGVFNHLAAEHRLSLFETAEMAYQIERVDLANLGGRQDQVATVFGGLNYIEFFANGLNRLEPVPVNHHIREELSESIVLFHVGSRGDSGSLIEDQAKNVSGGSEAALDSMHKAKMLARAMKQSLLGGNMGLFGELLHESWLAKKGFSSKISNPFLDKVYETARKHHAIGGKVSGAGGGGHMFFVVKPGYKNELIEAVTSLGCKYVPSQIEWQGLRTWEVPVYHSIES